MSRRVYRLLGSNHFPLTKEQLEQLVRDGLLSLETKVSQDGEGFATALGSRAEFQHLLSEHVPAAVAKAGRGRGRPARK